MARKQHKYHFIYKTVNQMNGKWYMGMHSTDNLEDGYIGSGKRLWYSIRKYGIENFKIEIQEFLPDRRSLKDREREIVNEGLLRDPMCMNLKLGGEGGFVNEEHKQKAQSRGGSSTFRLINKRHLEKLQNDEEYREKFRKSMRNHNKGEGNPFFGKHHSNETVQKMRNHERQSGGKNSQFGTKWITNSDLKQNKKINNTENIPDGWKLGRKTYKNEQKI